MGFSTISVNMFLIVTVFVAVTVFSHMLGSLLPKAHINSKCPIDILFIFLVSLYA
jgi:hypothetical protein